MGRGGGFRPRCCRGSTCAVPARTIRPTRQAQATSDCSPHTTCHTPTRRRCPSQSRPASLACPGRPSLPASPLSAPPRPSPPQQWGRPNVSNQQNRRQDSPPRHSRTANRRSVPARRHTAPLRPISLFPLRPPCTGWPGQLASQAPRCAAPAHPCGPHQIPLPGCALRPTHPALPSSPRLNSGHA